MTNLLCPRNMPMDVADVAFAGSVVHKNALNGRVGVRVMRKKEHPRGVTVEPMCWVKFEVVTVQVMPEIRKRGAQLIVFVPRC